MNGFIYETDNAIFGFSIFNKLFFNFSNRKFERFRNYIEEKKMELTKVTRFNFSETMLFRFVTKQRDNEIMFTQLVLPLNTVIKLLKLLQRIHFSEHFYFIFHH